MARVVSLNVGLPRTVEGPRGPVVTSIFKSPTERRLRAEPHNLDGDRQADPSVHGGENKAIYGYPLEHYARWGTELGRTDLTPGQFGENLTTEGLLEGEVGIGDAFEIGTARLQVTQPRSPCFKLGIRMDDATFVKAFLKSGRPGFYFRIVVSGDVGAGDTIKKLESGTSGLSVYDVWALSYGPGRDPEKMKAALEIPTLGEEWLRPIMARLGE